METIEYTLPAQWASYLINGDASSFSLNDDGGDEEIKMIDDFCKREHLSNCLGCSEEPEFSWDNDGPEPSLGGDVLTYTFEVI